MKVWSAIVKIIVALAAIAGIIYVAATYGDRITAWAKKLLSSFSCCCGCGCDCGCDCDEDFYEITCPNCDEEFSVDEDTLLDGGVECPVCGEHLEFDLDDCCCDDDDCCCDCDED